MRYLNPTTICLVILLIMISATAQCNPEGYTLIAQEDQSRTFNQPVDLAYGADGHYYYIDDFVGTIRFDNNTFGGDPIEGVSKAGYVKNNTRSSPNNLISNGFQRVANENQTMTFNRPVDLAYGAKDRYHYINDFVGTIRFDNETFGGDPIEGISKAGYMKPHRNTNYNNNDNNYGTNQDINDYQFAGNENETKTFHRAVDLAYGAKGRYYYIKDFIGTIRFDNDSFGGDPIEGINKSGYFKYKNTYQNDPQQHNINDYKLAAKEGQTMTFNYPTDLAYGAQGRYYLVNPGSKCTN